MDTVLNEGNRGTGRDLMCSNVKHHSHLVNTRHV